MCKNYETDIIKSIIQAGKRLDSKNLIAGTNGNFSVKISDNEVLITCSGKCKAMLEPEDITKVDLKGNIIYGKKPARDILMHLEVYKLRSDINAIIHTHPPLSTGLSVAGYSFNQILLPEVIFNLKSIAFAEYALPTTSQVPEAIREALEEKKDSNAVILSHHGAITMGADIMDACFKMEELEMISKAIIVTKIYGTSKELTNKHMEEIQKLL